MKKQFFIFSAILLAGTTMQALDFTSGSYCYRVNDDGTTVSVLSSSNGGAPGSPIGATVAYNGVTYQITKIAPRAFKDIVTNKLIVNDSYAKNLKEIGDEAFMNNTQLTQVKLPAPVTTIGANAFAGCPLTLVALNGTAFPTIAANTFAGANGTPFNYDGCWLTVLNSLAPQLQQTSEWNKFSHYGPSTDDNFTSGDFKFLWYSGMNNGTLTGLANQNVSEVELPFQADYYGCLLDIIRVGASAFKNNATIVEATIEDGYRYLLSECFRSASALTYVSIPNSVQAIYDNAFNGCTSLQVVEFDASMTGDCGDNIFTGCPIKTIITHVATPHALKTNAFDQSVYDTATLKVPAGAKSNYQATAPWSSFKNIEEDATLGIEAVMAGDATPHYYNLQGQEVENPENGIFIRRIGNKAIKVRM